MLDISMCKNKKCSKRNRCYRFLAKPNGYQSYFLDLEEKDCEYFWDIKKQLSVSWVNLGECSVKSAIAGQNTNQSITKKNEG